MTDQKFRLTTTLNLLRKKDACENGYRKLCKTLGPKWPEDQSINLLTILDSNGAQDTLWCLQATVEDSTRARCYMAADFAESVLHLFAEKYPDDKRPANAIQAARDFADGKIAVAAARHAARAAVDAARHAEAVTRTARVAGDAARVAAWAAMAAGAAARAAARASRVIGDAAMTAGVARDASMAAGDAVVASAAAREAMDAEEKKQEASIRKYLEPDHD